MPETIFRHMNKMMTITSSQHGSTKRKLCLTNFINFHDGRIGLVYEGKAVVVAYPDFRKAFNTVFHKILRQAAALRAR